MMVATITSGMARPIASNSLSPLPTIAGSPSQPQDWRQLRCNRSTKENVFDERSNCQDDEDQEDWAPQAHAPHHAAVHHLLHVLHHNWPFRGGSAPDAALSPDDMRASLALQALDNSFELRLYLLRHVGEARIINCLHRGNGVNG